MQLFVSADVRHGTPATVLCDGDPGLWELQRQVMPEAAPFRVLW